MQPGRLKIQNNRSDQFSAFAKDLPDHDLVFRAGCHELKTVLEPASLAYRSLEPHFRRYLRASKLHPDVAAIRQLTGHDRPESAFTDRDTPAGYELIRLGLNGNTDTHVELPP